MKKIIPILIIVSMLLVSCSVNSQQVNLENTTPTVTATKAVTIAPTDTPEPTPTYTPVPTQPKYIFIVIGDGFGRGHMMMGGIYARLENEDMSKGAFWESFPMQKMVDGRGESASGGTAIATGYVAPANYISQNTEIQDLYTIMDRAKQNGMSTGVVTNSFMLDATPATFLSHEDYRLNFSKMSPRMAGCNVDYIAGGGIMRLVPQSYYSNFSSVDARNRRVAKSQASQQTDFPEFLEMGYTPYIGLTGAKSYLEQVEAGTFSDEKSICLFTESTMTYETRRINPDYVDECEYVPTLSEMVEGGIQTLSQNPSGFVMAIEEASIDKRGHNGSHSGIISQVKVLNDALGAVMEFYNEHPYETLVILTADHETGEFAFSEEKYAEFLTYPSFTWSDNSTDIISFMENQWDVEVYGSKVTGYIKDAISSPWGNTHEDRAQLYNYLTLQTSNELGIRPTTEYHSWQLVPLCTTGVGSENFEKATGIQDVPIIICEILGWDALPAVNPEQSE